MLPGCLFSRGSPEETPAPLGKDTIFMDTLLAYFDPGSGSMLLQMILGGGAGLVVFGKYLWDTLFGSRS